MAPHRKAAATWAPDGEQFPTPDTILTMHAIKTSTHTHIHNTNVESRATERTA
jgi:hypothetical protein